MLELEISPDVAATLTSEGIRGLSLSVGTRSYSCSTCGRVLRSADGPASVVAYREPDGCATLYRLAHRMCEPSELRQEAAVEAPRGDVVGLEWNLLLRRSAVAAVLAWECSFPLDESAALGVPDPLAIELHAAGFVRADGAIDYLSPPTATSLTLGCKGEDLVLARGNARWVEFTGVRQAEPTGTWLGEAHRGGRCLVLYGTAMGGEAPTRESLQGAIDAGLVLAAFVELGRVPLFHRILRRG
jgi:hypothetical protein